MATDQQQAASVKAGAWPSVIANSINCFGVLRSSIGLQPGMASIIADFVRDLPAQVNQLECMLEHQQIDPLRCLVHQLRGACGGYGFEPVTDIATAAENAIKTGQNRAAISTCIDSLIEVIQRIEGYDSEQSRMAA